jgi:calcineurin-like phosphoesterase family protein
MAIFIVSDLHLGHSKDFIYGARGFESVEDMNETIIRKWNEIVDYEDDVYVMGDLVMGPEANLQMLRRLKGRLHLVRGNHDTDTRWGFCQWLPNVVEANNSLYLYYGGYKFYLTHYPTITTRADAGKPLKKCLVNLCGHTHTKDPFEDWGFGMIYHCEVDAHDCTPVRIEDIIMDLKQKMSDRAE